MFSRNRLAWRRPKGWDDHVDDMEQLANTPGFQALREQLIAHAQLRATDRVLDIGAGTGLLTLAAAPKVSRVWALDASQAMCRTLTAKLTRSGITNVDVAAGSVTTLPFEDASFDVVLSNYCFHHLTDAEKRVALAEVGRALRPDGRLVFGDMMFAVGLWHQRDRAVILRFVGMMLGRGPAGVLRLIKNALRLASGRGEHPVDAGWWCAALADAGFTGITVRALDHEGGIAVAQGPGRPDSHPAGRPSDVVAPSASGPAKGAAYARRGGPHASAVPLPES